MRRATTLLVVLAMMLAFAAPAFAVILHGGPGDDTLTGTDRADKIEGRFGNDTIRGLGGPDVLGGGNGNDRLVGGGGQDFLAGGFGNDTLVAGDDKQSDELRGGPGFDTCIVSGNDNSKLNITSCEVIEQRQ